MGMPFDFSCVLTKWRKTNPSTNPLGWEKKSRKLQSSFFFFFQKKLTHSQSLRLLPNLSKKILPTFTLKINFPFPLIGLLVIECLLYNSQMHEDYLQFLTPMSWEEFLVLMSRMWLFWYNFLWILNFESIKWNIKLINFKNEKGYSHSYGCR